MGSCPTQWDKAFGDFQASLGAVRAAAIVAAVDLLIAAIGLLVGSNSRLGPEIDVAFEVRKMAIEAIQADARDLKLTFEGIGQGGEG
jgi:hypothetical protein